jgi:D-glycero-D-manno-heptose 1,7-bisphosphate phosphatase
MALFLLDRDGVVVVNRRDNIKTPADLRLIAGAGPAIARLNRAGVTVAICTNQPEVARGVMTRAELEAVHRGLADMLLAEGATVDRVLCCTAGAKCPRLKPAAGMLAEALARYGAAAAETPFVGDQADDLRLKVSRNTSRRSRCTTTWPPPSTPGSPAGFRPLPKRRGASLYRRKPRAD